MSVLVSVERLKMYVGYEVVTSELLGGDISIGADGGLLSPVKSGTDAETGASSLAGGIWARLVGGRRSEKGTRMRHISMAIIFGFLVGID